MALEDSILRNILLNKEVSEPANAVPLLLIGLGGSGAEVVKRVKLRAGWLGLKNSVRFLVADTDPGAVKGKNGLPDLEDHEFAFLNNAQAKIILDNLDLNESASERMGLDEPDIATQLRDFTRVAQDGAGQVPRNATLKLFGSMTLFRNKLREAISHLNRRWAQLQLPNVQGQTFSTIVVGSVCGGTGAGMLLDTACFLENELYNHESQLMAILFMPEVFDFDTRGKKDDYERMRANAYATLRELDFFRTALAHRNGVNLGRDIKTPQQDMFKSVSLVSRIDANNQDLRNSSAVFDSIGLYLGAFISETLQQALLSGLCNDNPVDTDPRLNRQRNVGSIAATALSLPVYELLCYCAYRQATEIVEDFVLGQQPAHQATTKAVDEWLKNSKLEERAMKGADFLVDRFKELLHFDPAKTANRLYKKEGASPEFVSDKEFISRFDKALLDWQSDLDTLKTEAATRTEGLKSTSGELLNKQVAGLIKANGIRTTLAFLKTLVPVLDSTNSELDAEAGEHKSQAAQERGAATNACAWLRKFPGNIGTDKVRQNNTIQAFGRMVHDEGLTVIKRAASQVISHLSSVAAKMSKQITQQLEAWDKVASHLKQMSAEHRMISPAIPHGESQAELSILSPDYAESFYQASAMANVACQEQIASEAKESFVDFVLKSGAKKNVWEQIVMIAGRHFVDRIFNLDVGTVVAEEIAKDTDFGKELEKRLKLVLTGCTPLWQARPQSNTNFEDGLAAGLTPGSNEVIEAIVEDCNATVARDPLYQAKFSILRTNDKMRIYAIRRVAGAMSYYLPHWNEYKQCYESWRKRTLGNAAHTLPSKHMSKLPRMEPAEKVTDGERAFAIALAYGFIARRGRTWYMSLSKRKTDEKFVVECDSEEDSLSFVGKKRQLPADGSMEKLIEADRVLFQNSKKLKELEKLSEGTKNTRQLAMSNFAAKEDHVKLVLEAFEALCEEGTLAKVADELESYLTQLRAKDGPAREIDIVEEIIGSLLKN